MSLNLNQVGHSTVDSQPWTWTRDDALRYAISVGAGDGDLDELAFTTENSRDVEQAVLPTFATVMGMSGDLSMSELGDFSLTQVLHAGQRVRLHTPIPVAGSVQCIRTVEGMYDLGKNALIELGSRFETTDGERLVETVSQIMVRGEGGFDGPPAPRDDFALPDTDPDHVVVMPTHRNQALLYRLNGDRNPLHSDPSFAKMAGFDQPILHGLCTYGFAARAVFAAVAEARPERFNTFQARFSSPVFPGEELTTSIWRTDDQTAVFQTRVDDRVVLDRGVFVHH